MKTIKRILVTLFLALALPSWAQTPPRISWLWPGTIERNAQHRAAFMTGMRRTA